MSNVIGGVLLLLAVVVAVMCLIGLITPKWLKYSKTGDAPKRSRIALVLLFVPVILLGIGGSLIDKPAKENNPSVAESTSDSQPKAASSIQVQPASPAAVPTPAPKVAERKNLGMTAEEFRKAYNAVIADPKSRMQSLPISEGTVNDVAMFTMWNVYVNATVNKQTGKVQGLLMGMGKGEPEEAIRGLIVLVAAAQAATPGESKEKVANTIAELVQQAARQLEDDKAPSKKIILGDREFQASASQVVGLMISISPK